jgi:hypothetical protein
VASCAVALAVPLGGVPRAAAQPTAREITYNQWTTGPQLQTGRFAGTRAVRGSLRLSEPVRTVRYRDPHRSSTKRKRYDLGRWTSRWTRPGFGFTELIPSWDAQTPGSSFVRLQVRGRSESGRRSRWYTMANWAEGDRFVRRASLGPQTDDLAQVNVDTLSARYSMAFQSFQLRVSLLRRTGSSVTPVVETVGAMTSNVPAVTSVRTSRPGVARGITLELPAYSQMIHEGDYPEYDNGGEAWCSPTSVSMVLGYYGRLPTAEEYAWVKEPHPDRFVDHAARSTYDYRYDGAGNWSFSTAYAATKADHAFVTRLRSLREAERLIKAGIPVVASVRFGRGELEGAPISSTNGHLLVIVGFTESGDVVVNDPAAPDNGSVVRTYDRGQFENAWIPESGGLVYVIRTSEQRLPKSRTDNW